jgi:hypothetical protein
LGRFRLPVSGRVVALRPLCGDDELLLLEGAGTPSGDAAVALALAGRLSRDVAGAPVDWGSLSVTDLDALVLHLRQALLGDRIRADLACPARGCGRRIDVSFSIADFLAHHAPRKGGARKGGWALEPAEEPGWFCLARAAEKTGTPGAEPAPAGRGVRALGSSASGPECGPVRFRLPTAADQLAVTGDPAAEDAMARRCLRPAEIPARLRRRVEAVMEAMAPSLSSEVQGSCPECGAVVTLHFDARWFCLRELRDRAAFVYQDIDLLARRYHWSESEILAMPNVRRVAYAELARQDWGG